MLKTVQETIDKNSLITSGDKIIIGVSGGPDSIALLHCLHRLKDVYDLTLIGAHINHGVRGEDASKDELYAKEFCQNIGIAFHAIRVNIEDIAQEKKISSEMAGREVRYQYRVYFHYTERSIKPNTYMFWEDRRLDIEDVLINFKLDHPDAVPLSVQENDRFIWSKKDEEEKVIV